MADSNEAQLRLLYSLLKPVVRVAARFHVPVRTLGELMRLAYFESLRERGLSQKQIALRLGQTERNIRSFARRLKTDFFAAENEVGHVREVENVVATRRPTRGELAKHLSHLSAEQIDVALDVLIHEGRVEREGTRWRAAAKYSLLGSDKFHQRIDALNHFLDGVHAAVINRLVFNRLEDAMLKTITFSAIPEQFHDYLRRFEGGLREAIAELEQSQEAEGSEGKRFTMAIAVAPSDLDEGDADR